jgi:amino acid transporter
MGAISLIGALQVGFQAVAELLNFGAFVGFILVNLSVIRHYYMRLGQRRGMQTVTNLVFPLAGALTCGYVWISLTAKTKVVGFGWLAIGALYLAILTRGFRVPPKKLEFS